MPSERQDVKPAGDPSAPAEGQPQPNAQTPGSPEPQTPSNEGQPDGQPQTVPYDRFRQVYERAQRAEQRANQLTSEVTNMSAHIRQVNEKLTEHGLTVGSQQRGPQGPAPVDPADEEIREELFGNTEEGRAYYKAMEKYFAHKLGQQDSITRAEAQAMAEEMVNKAMSKLGSAISAPNEISKMVQKGMITQEEGRGLQGELNRIMQQPKWQTAIESDPENVNYLIDRLFRRAVDSGRIKPFSRPRPEPPLQPGGNGQTPAPPEELPEIDLERTPFPSLRNISKEKADELTSKSRSRYEGAI